MLNPRLIINADDFGYHSTINAAIVSCFQKKLVNSTTIIVNANGFEEAIELANKYGFKESIGIHVNLTEGKPVTDLSETSLVDQKGNFIMKGAFSPRIFLSRNTRKKIKAEIRAQYKRLLAYGIHATHIDSHHNVHTLPWLAPLFVEFAKEVNLKLRISEVIKRKLFFLTVYNSMLNMYFKQKAVHFTDKFGNINYLMNYLCKKKNFKPVFEIMVHPGYKENLLIDTWLKTPLEEQLTHLKQLYNKKALSNE